MSEAAARSRSWRLLPLLLRLALAEEFDFRQYVLEIWPESTVCGAPPIGKKDFQPAIRGQVWQSIPGTDGCLLIYQGFSCSMNLNCQRKLTCSSRSKSGVALVQFEAENCNGREVGQPEPFLEDLSYPMLHRFFKNRECVVGPGDGLNEATYMRFTSAWDNLDLPGNCSVFATDTAGGPKGPTYTLDIFEDSGCVKRVGAQHDWLWTNKEKGCFDVVDKPTGNRTVLNFKLECGTSGNGVVVQRFTGTKCSGTKGDRTAFPAVFYMVTWAELDSQLFMGKCQDLRDGTYGKFRRPLNADGYEWPGCISFAKNNFLGTADVQEFQYRIYPGNISTVRNAAFAWRTRLHWPVALLLLLLRHLH